MSVPVDHRVRLCVELDFTRDIVFRAVEMELDRYGINTAQAKLLYILAGQKEGISLNDIAELACREFNTVSILINKMEKRGLVQKAKIAGDDKAYISLTPEGKTLWGETITTQAMTLIFDSLTDQERTELKGILQKLQHTARELMGLNYKPPFLP